MVEVHRVCCGEADLIRSVFNDRSLSPSLNCSGTMYGRSIERDCSCYGLRCFNTVCVDQPAEWGATPMGHRRGLGRLAGILCVLLAITGCASEFSVFSASGQPLLISRRGYSPSECAEKVKNDAARIGVTLRYIHIRGTTVGRSLLWPFEAGYACEAAIGPEQGPTGPYPSTLHILSRGS